MTVQDKNFSIGRGRLAEKRAAGVWEILCWAFQRECVTLDPQEERTGIEARVNLDPIYQMVQIAELGCRVDGGGRSASHPDADIVAATVTVLPESCGGWQMACAIAELARTGQVPAWDLVPQVVPVETTTNRWGTHAKTADARELGAEGWPHLPRKNRKGRVVHDRVSYCPVTIRPTPYQIGRAHRDYLAWYGALLEIRNALQITTLTAFVVTDRMPPRAPWKKQA